VKQQRNFIFGSIHFFITNTKGFLDLNHLPSAQQKNSESQTHVHCYLQLKLFVKQQKVDLILDNQCRNDIAKRNEQVKKER